MSRSTPRHFFGIHSVSPYNRTTGLFYGMLECVGSSSLALSGELVELKGGSSKYSWAAEEAGITSEMSLKPKEFPDFLFTLFFGKTPTSSTADTSGSVSTLTNKNGSSIADSSTGIASVSVKAAKKADLKFAKYVVVATDATHVDVYASSDADFSHGTDKSFESDALKITASPLEITTSTAVEIPDFGLELTGGSGTIGMTTSDTATFEVKPVSARSMSVVVGAKADSFPEFGAIIMGQKRGNELVEVDCYRCKGAGFPLGFDEFKFAEVDAKAKVLYDSAKNALFALRWIEES